MLYEKLKELSNADFKRYCGVPKPTFDKMCQIVRDKSAKRRLIAGRPSKLMIEDQMLLTLEYWREYRTQFHIAKSWSLSEATVSRIIVRIEDILTAAAEFDLPGKRFPDLPPDVEVIIVDVAESPIERPKKTAAFLFGQEKAAHDKDTSPHLPPDAADFGHSFLERRETRFFPLQTQQSTTE